MCESKTIFWTNFGSDSIFPESDLVGKMKEMIRSVETRPKSRKRIELTVWFKSGIMKNQQISFQIENEEQKQLESEQPSTQISRVLGLENQQKRNT